MTLEHTAGLAIITELNTKPGLENCTYRTKRYLFLYGLSCEDYIISNY